MKINGQTITTTHFVWDGCHKIYLLETPEDEAKAIEYGYDAPIPISEIQDVWEQSCSLRFISTFGSLQDVVPQFEEAKFAP